MAKKKYVERPVSEFTEEELRWWFENLRKLYKEATHRIHELKEEKKALNTKINWLLSAISKLKKEAREENIKPKSDFKKKFLDSL